MVPRSWARFDIGYSSPVVYDNQIWVTTAKSDGKELYAVCTDYKTGKIVAEVCDVLLTVGIRSRKIAEGALDALMSEKNIFEFDAFHLSLEK